MTDGIVQINAGKVLVADGKVATSDECCCGECDNCQAGTSPDTIQLVVAGIAADACADCSGLNGTFLLDTGVPDDCLWGADPGIVCAGAWSYGLTLDGAGVLALILDGPALNLHGWSTDLGDVPIDCSAWSGLGIPWVNQSGFPWTLCDSSGSSVALTSL